MEDLKKIHDDLYETLIEFDNFCNKFDIKYSLTSGTLIGAIRENGFIPRDDDIDIMMSREEYQKFLNIAVPYYNDNLDSKIKIETYTLDKNYTLFYGAFINISKEHSGYQNPKKFPKKYPNGVWLDIFPFDYINPSKILKGFYNFYIRTLTSSFAYKTFEVTNFTKFLKVAFSKLLLKKFLIKKYNNLVSKGLKRKKSGKKYAICCFNFFRKNSIKLFYFKSGLFDKIEMHKFENKDFPIISEYDYFLREIFNDYMTPPKDKNRKPKHMEDNCE